MVLYRLQLLIKVLDYSFHQQDDIESLYQGQRLHENTYVRSKFKTH